MHDHRSTQKKQDHLIMSSYYAVVTIYTRFASIYQSFCSITWYIPSDTLCWWPSLDDLGSSSKLAFDSNSIDIKCKTDNTSYQALDMVVSCKERTKVTGTNWSAFFSIGSKLNSKICMNFRRYLFFIFLVHPNKLYFVL